MVEAWPAAIVADWIAYYTILNEEAEARRAGIDAETAAEIVAQAEQDQAREQAGG